MSLEVTNPLEFKQLNDYSDKVSTLCEGFNNNASLSAKLASNSVGSGVVNDGVGTVAGKKVLAFDDPSTINPAKITIDGWKVYFSDISKIIEFNTKIVNLIPDDYSDGIKYLYLTSSKDYKILDHEKLDYDPSLVYLLRYEVLNKKLVSLMVMPDLAGTDVLSRTQLANQIIQVYNCSVSPVAGTTSLKVSDCTMMIEGGNIYQLNGVMDKNLVAVHGSDKADIYYCDANDMLSASQRSTKTKVVNTGYYKKITDHGGVIEILPEGKYSVQQLSLSPDGSLVAQYGSEVYDTMEDAIRGVTNAKFNFINLTKADIYSPVCRVVYKSGAVNGVDPTRFRVELVQYEGQVVSGGASGGSVQSQVADINTRVERVERRPNIVVCTDASMPSVASLRNYDMIMVIKE